MLEHYHTGLTMPFSFEFQKGEILGNGDILLCSEINEENTVGSYDVVLALFDSNKDFKLKKIKQLFVDYQSMATCSDKICLTNQV